MLPERRCSGTARCGAPIGGAAPQERIRPIAPRVLLEVRGPLLLAQIALPCLRRRARWTR
jgi:hypothetical protein